MNSYIKLLFTASLVLFLDTFLYASNGNTTVQQKTVYIKQIIVKNTANKKETQDIDKIVKSYLNTNLSLNDIKSVQSKLNKYYKDQGYVFTKVVLAAQNLSKSILRFTVIRAKAGTINITGNKYYSSAFIKKNFGIKKGDHLDYNTMLKSLLLLNEYDDLIIKSYLKKGSSFATTDITLKVKDKKPSHLNLSFDNYGSKNTSEYRTNINYLYGNLIQDGDKIIIDSTIGLNSANTKLIRTNYTTTPFGKYHTKLNFGFLYANYTVAGDFSVLGLKGNSYIYKAGIIQPIIRSITNTLDLNLNYSRQDAKSYLLGALSSRNKLNIIDMQFAWQHKRIFDDLSINFDITKGFNGDGSFGSRLNEDTNFLKYNLSTSYNRYINEKNNILLSLNAQYSAYKLPISQLSTLGGISSVRGYDSAEELGDSSYVTSAEWFYHPAIKNKFLKNSLQLGLAINYGREYTNDPVPGASKSVTLTGAGIDLIANIKKKYFGRISLGYPISSSVSNINKKVQISAYFGIKFW